MRRAPPFLIVVVVLVLILQTAMLIKVTNDVVNPTVGIQAKATTTTGSVSLCINRPPTINLSNCDTIFNQSTAIENNTYTCQALYSVDVNESINFTNFPIIQKGLDFSINSSGTLTIWANQSGIGLYSGTVRGYDTSVCPMFDQKDFVFRILDINDPPILSENFQSPTLREGSQLSYAFLNGYFYDADDDSLVYTVSEATYFNIVILPSSEVIIVNPANQCEDENIYFTATDPLGLSADSNMITLKAECVSEQESSGAGGGSGGCTPEWDCQRWSQCFANGTRERICVDLNGCNLDNLRKSFTEECIFEETCFDGIQNQDETGIDCGGVCPACPVVATCFDGIKNQDEEEVDCGGPNCDACIFEETCFDGIKNQNETGVDCGGPCDPCKEIQVPGLIEETSSILSVVLIIALILAASFLTYILFRKEIRTIIAKISWWLKRKKRKQMLLDDKTKQELLKVLRDVEVKLEEDKISEIYKSDDKIVHNILSANRLYVVKAFKLPLEFDKQELIVKSDRVLFHNDLKNIFKSFMDKQLVLETRKILISKLHLSFMVEELKTLILSTSVYSKSDYFYSAKEYKIEGNTMTKIVKLLHNALIALQFLELDVAKKRYLEIISLYELLSEREKNIIYNDISRLYNYIGYEIAWA